MRIFANANYPFLSWRRKGYLASAILLAVGIVAMVVNTASIGSWLRYGVDFSGGTLIQVDFQGEVSADQIRAVNPDWQITRFGEVGSSEYLIRMASTPNADEDPSESAATSLESAFGADAFEIVRTEAVTARVGAELQQRALIAILISIVGTLIYLAFRFEWRFGVAASAASAHDILLTLGLLALLRMEISVSTVAAFLTIVGYSLNDTIVVFDRIRENIGKRKRGETLIDISNRSINETLPRTILTSGTTLVTLLSLYLFGGAVIRDFALVLILGVAIGTFSSIFIAVPVLVEIEKKWPHKEKKAAGGVSGSRRRTPARV